MRKYWVILLLCLPMALSADLLSDILSGKYKPASLPDMCALADGEHYAQQVGNDVFSYSYRTGAVADTLFCLDKVRALRCAKPQSIDGYLLSPAGRYMLVYTNVKKVFRRSFTADYYICDMKRRELKALSDTMPLQSPVFSPDGKYIAFSRDNNLYIHKLEFGTEVQVTTDGIPGEVYNGTADWLYEEEFDMTYQYAFSPDSKQLAYLRIDDRQVPVFTWMNYLDAEGKPLTYPVMEHLRYPKAGETNPKASVCVYDTYYKSIKTMALPAADEDCYLPRLRWTTDANALAIFRLNRDQNDLRVYYANPKSTLATLMYTEHQDNGYIDFEQFDEWEWLSDNSFITVSMTDGYRHAWLYSATGQRQRCLTPGEYDVTAFYGYDEPTQTVFYQAAAKDATTRYLFSRNVKKGVITQYSDEAGTQSAVFSPGYAYFVETFSSASCPTQYRLYTRQGKCLRVLESNEPLREKAASAGLPQKEFFTFTTERGTVLNGWMLRPATSGKHPVLVYNYSGPQSQSVLNRWKIDWEEYLALKEGIMVVCIDPRGTDARGEAFREETYMHLGKKEAEDLVSLGHWLARRDDVDARHMAIWGWSGGGYYTIRTLSEAGSPYCCGMAVAPVTDWRLYDSAYTERFMRRPQVNEDGYADASLIQMPTALSGRLLIVHGLADDNVHAQHTLLYTEALTAAGMQYEMQIYPDDNHFLRKRGNREHVYRRMLTFLKQQFAK